MTQSQTICSNFHGILSIFSIKYIFIKSLRISCRNVFWSKISFILHINSSQSDSQVPMPFQFYVFLKKWKNKTWSPNCTTYWCGAIPWKNPLRIILHPWEAITVNSSMVSCGGLWALPPSLLEYWWACFI